MTSKEDLDLCEHTRSAYGAQNLAGNGPNKGGEVMLVDGIKCSGGWGWVRGGWRRGEVWWNTLCKCCTALLPSHVSFFQLLHPVLWQPQGQYHKTILTQNSY